MPSSAWKIKAVAKVPGLIAFFFNCYRPLLDLHSFPTRRSSDLLKVIGCASLDELVDRAIPENIRLRRRLQLPEPSTEYEALNRLRTIAGLNRRSEEHTSELQSRRDLVCRLLLGK